MASRYHDSEDERIPLPWCRRTELYPQNVELPPFLRASEDDVREEAWPGEVVLVRIFEELLLHEESKLFRPRPTREEAVIQASFGFVEYELRHAGGRSE